MKIGFCLLVATLVLAACAPSATGIATPVPTLQTTLSATALPPTSIPSPLPSPTSTLTLPVDLRTSVPAAESSIALSAVSGLREVARYYGRLPYVARLSTDGKRLVIRDALGVDIYDHQSGALLSHLPLFSTDPDELVLRLSNDGSTALVDGHLLLRLNSEGTAADWNDLNKLDGLAPQLRGKIFALSNDGNKIAIEEYACDTTCLDRFSILDVGSGKFEYVSDYGANKALHGFYPVYSPYDRLIATQADNRIVVWNVSDKLAVQKFLSEPITAGFSFSPDSRRLAVRQRSGAVDVWDIQSGVKVQTFQSDMSYCSGMRQVMTSTPLISGQDIIAIFGCHSGDVTVYSLSNGQQLDHQQADIDVASVTFADGDNLPTILSVPHSIGPWDDYSGYGLTTLQFTQDGKLAFRINGKECSVSLAGDVQRCTDNLVLGTDGKYYSIEKGTNEFTLRDTAGGDPLALSIKWPGRDATVTVLDVKHHLLIYNAWLNTYTAQGMVSNLDNGATIGKWLQRSVDTLAISPTTNSAMLCLRLFGYGTGFNDKGKLVLVDLEQSKITYEVQFPCNGAPMAASPDGRQFAVAKLYATEGWQSIRSDLQLIDMENPYQRQTVKVECAQLGTSGYASIGALAYSPDGDMLVAGCRDGSLHFINRSDDTEITRLDGFPNIDALAFSPRGDMLAVAWASGVLSILSNVP